MATDPLAKVRNEVGLRVAEIRESGRRLSPMDLYARMDAIRQLAALNGLAALEGLARRSAQMALLPGHRVAVQCCLEHVDEALDSHSDGDCNAILAALPLKVGSGQSPIDARNRDWMRNDIQLHAQQAISEDEFRDAVRRIRERKEKERREKEKSVIADGKGSDR